MNHLNHALENTAPDALYDQQEQAEFDRSIALDYAAHTILEDHELLDEAISEFINSVEFNSLFRQLSNLTQYLDEDHLNHMAHGLIGYLGGIAAWYAPRLIRKENNQ